MAPYETKLSEMQHANFTTYSNLKYYHVIEKPESVKSWERYTQTKQFPIFSICISYFLVALICILLFGQSLLFTMQTNIQCVQEFLVFA
jgi:hypothetical protein